MSEGTPTVVRLATDQLTAYNAADLDAFCACYHEDVVVLDDDGSESLRGAEAFRARYAPMFARGGFVGQLILAAQARNTFRADDLDVLVALASVAALAYARTDGPAWFAALS